MARAAHFDWGGMVTAFRDSRTRMKGIDQQLAADSQKIWDDNAKFIKGIWSPIPATTTTQRSGPVPDTTAKADPAIEAIRARIAALQQEATGWLLVSSAGTRAEQLIAEATKKGNDEFNKLKQEAARDKNDPAGALALVLQNEGIIKGAEAAQVFGTAIKSLNSDLDKQGDKFQEEGKAATALAAAYRQGGTAVAAAALGKQFASDAAQLDMLVQVQRLLAGTRTSGQMLGPVAKDAAGYKQLSDAINVATKAMEANKAAASAALAANLAAEIGQEISSFTALSPHVEAINSAYLKSADAVRAARVELELYQWRQEQLSKGVVPESVSVTVRNPLTGADQTMSALDAQRRAIQEKDEQAYEGTLKQEAAQYDLNVLYDDEITKLLRLKQILDDNGADTLLVNAKIFDSQDTLIHQWDEAALKVGTFAQKVQGVMNELALQGKEAGAQIGKAFLSAIDSGESALAKRLTGQKTNFKQIAQGLGESLVKIGIQKTVGDFASALGIKGVGGTKPDGSSNNPFYVVFKGGAGSLLGGIAAGGATAGGAGGGDNSLGGRASGVLGNILNKFAGGGGGGTGGGGSRGQSGLSGIFSKFASGIANKFFSTQLQSMIAPSALGQAAAMTQTSLGTGAAESLGGAEGGGIGAGADATADSSALDFSDLFGGFMASGGDVSPGKAYVVGEKRPELFIPPTAGRISNSVPNLSGKPAKQINVTNHFNVPAPVDLFKKSHNQLNTEQARQLSVANSR